MENGKDQGHKDIVDEDADSTNGILINNEDAEEEGSTKDENISSPWPWGRALQKSRNISSDL